MKSLKIASVLVVFLAASFQAQAGFLTTAVASVVIAKAGPKVIEKAKDYQAKHQKNK